MLFSQDRNRTRELFRQAWRKHRDRQPAAVSTLEPLERQIVDLIEMHPEYQPLFESDAEVLDTEFRAEDGMENPFLHLGLHLALREQVGTDRPAGIAAITRALLLKHGDGHEVEHRMMERLGLSLWEAQQQGRAPDEATYLDSLRRLI